MFSKCYQHFIGTGPLCTGPKYVTNIPADVIAPKRLKLWSSDEYFADI